MNQFLKKIVAHFSLDQSGYLIITFSILIASLIFSYQPATSFGTLSGFNLKISVTELAVVLFVCASFGIVYRYREAVFKPLGVKLFLGLCSLSTISVLWSANKPRGLFVTGFLWLLLLLFIAIQAWKVKTFITRSLFVTIVWYSTLAACAFAWWQVIGDALGVPPNLTLLPVNYQSILFGFARPTGFALEPQFLGSLLLGPIIAAAYLELRKSSSPIVRVTLIIAFATLIATLSRGALVGLAIGLIALFVFVRSSFITFTKTISFMLAGLVLSVSLLAFSAQINTRDTINGYTALTRAINQISLGAITLSSDDQEPIRPAPTTASNSPQQQTSNNTPVAQPVTTSPPFTGYVEESTSSRLLMAKEAIGLWQKDIGTVVFGIGAGGFGAQLHRANALYSVGSIVNNQYIEVLVELGAVGLCLFLSLLLFPLWRLFVTKQWLGLSVLVAYYAQWFFFSGNTNIIHVWLAIALAYALLAAHTTHSKHLRTA